jgi:single-strand DNA-binding protein
MNKIILMGRLTRDPEIRYTSGEKPMAIARYSIAVDRKYKREDGNTADFFNIVAFDRAGDFAARFLHKGTKMVISGHVQTGSYENKDGIRMPFFEVVAEEQEFAESKNAENHNEDKAHTGNSRDTHPADGSELMELPDDMDDLPFA